MHRGRHGNALRVCLISLCLAAAIPFTETAQAETVLVIGSAGADGLVGAPGLPGDEGLSGEGTTAVATLDGINEAAATGGRGGDGGNGGNALDASTPAGNGGNGGAGGNASASSDADATGPAIILLSESAAIGGSGGDAGVGGSNGDGSFGARGVGGSGGEALALVSTSSTAAGPGANSLQSTSTGVATGGDGGSGELGGNGGDGTGRTAATIDGVSSVFLAESTANGGTGGNSISDGGRGGNGGVAVSEVVAIGSITRGSISSESAGGQGGLGGSNSGLNGGGGDGGGAASSADVAINGVISPTGFNSLTIETLSEGGFGGSGWGEGFDAGRGGAAAAQTTASGASTNTTVRATSRGGDGGLGLRGAVAGDGGAATISEVTATSANGSSLTVEARAEAGNGGGVASSNVVGPLPTAADGGQAEVVNAVAGTTSGSLILNQVAIGGDGGDGTADAGDGGSAISALTREVNSGFVRVSSTASAGDGGSTERGLAGRGGDADSSASIISNEGAATVEIGAVGGDSGGTSDDSNVLAALGGDGMADAYVETRGDSHSISIGSSFFSGAIGGSGGDTTILPGGTLAHGGHATSRSVGVAVGNSAVQIIDRATGGDGGRGGSLFEPGAAGDGGHASSYAEGSSAGSSLVSVEARATGGAAGGRGDEASEFGRAGDAEAIARGSSSGGGDVIVTARQTGGSGTSGSIPQSSGADTRMEDAVSGFTTAKATLRQYATGGDGGALARGGSATSILNARNEGGGELEAISDATGGDASGSAEAEIIISDTSGSDIVGTAVAHGGDAGVAEIEGGVGSARAFGSSSAGGNVTAAAELYGGDGIAGGAGANAALVNAVSGETTGTLTLMQTAEGGLGGSGSNGSATGRSGVAISEIDATNPAGGALVVMSTAIGGRGARGSGTSPFAPGGEATASGRAIDVSGSDVDLHVVAQGGDANEFTRGGISGDGGKAFLGRVYASSVSGNVTIEGAAIGGSAVQQQNQSGRGASVALTQGVDGDTSGRLTLIQNATGGDGSATLTSTIPSGAGNASSHLDRTKSAEHLTLSVTAQAGGQIRTNQTEAFAVGGDADARVSGTNDAGGVSLLARAIGGDFETFNGFDGTARRGGNATVSATSMTVVDGADIQIGLPSSANYGAEGGQGATNAFFNPNVQGGRGGEATSESIGIALGESAVAVFDRAIGGTGARDDDFRIQFNGEGGDGTSYAEARTAGTNDAIANSNARGGTAGQGSSDPGPGPAGGNASATAMAEGLGASRASALSFGGSAAQSSIGEANSQATAIGGLSAYAETSGSGRAEALAIAVLSGPGPIAETRVTTFESSARSSPARASSHVFYDGREQTTGFRRTSADVRVSGPLSTAESLTSDVLAEIDLNITGSERNNEMLDNRALVEMVLATPASDLSSEIFVDFATDVDQEASFDLLHLSISLGGDSLVDETFSDVSSAILFFATTSNLFLGTLESIGADQISISMAIESVSRNDQFSAQFSLVQVPEPNTAMLLLIGLGVLSATNRRA